MATRIPINKDNSYHFDDRNKKIWEDMEHDMERRRREWEGEIDKMRSDFFHMRPEKPGTGALDFDSLDGGGHLVMAPPRMPPVVAPIDSANDGKPVIEKDHRGMPVFKVRFNMKDYRPEEVNVKMDSNKIMVSAKHEEKSSGSTVSREYNREVNVPVEVDPLALQCLFQPDGFLVFTAPLPAPKYDAIKDGSGSSVVAGGASSSSSLHHPSSSSPKASSVKSSSSSSYHSSSSGGSGGGGGGNNKMNGSDGGGPHGGILSHSNPPLHHHPHHHMNQQQQQHHHHHHQPQQHHQHQLQHHHQPKVLHISQPHITAAAPSPPSFPSSSSTTSSSSSKFTEQPDVIVPSFRAPPDINKLLDAPVQMPPLHSSPLPKPPPFTSLSSTFPAGPIFPDSTQQIQLSVPMVTSHDGKFQLTMPIDDFKPEDLTVKTQDGKVIICAKREVLSGSRNHTMEMNREHSLPDNVDPLTVKAFFTDTNMLIVEAPLIRG